MSSFNVHTLTMHIMDYTVVENTVVYYKLELLDEQTGDCMTVLRRYSAIATFRQMLLKEIEASCICPPSSNACKHCLAALKAVNFPAKSWFPKDSKAIQPELVAARATELSYFLQDVVAVVREHAPLCSVNQAYLEAALGEILGAHAAFVPPPRARKGERSASCELPELSKPPMRERSESVPVTTKRLIL
ncbi:Aste57867_19408 [Aphanomyces stellatus]|uniref:Aste57867_19408 protein n=1 Tax=Aphanomyces stellatus TaxID=120398 RepID=A0A485LGQ6_9STRA|nr:hypothetical protein As57867_019344 [Aphanomyces stellatus]VFT96122.1 Aste57867_19408 [Aphanomyces stellatus]